jgi:hypothetical protein
MAENIKMNPKEIGYEDVDWIHLVQFRMDYQALVNTVKNPQVLQKAYKFLTI